MTMRPRVIPLLLIGNGAAVKTILFDRQRYIGDYVNAARIFSDLGADELILLDTDARREGRSISPETVSRVADEISMPLAAGGGISNIKDVSAIIAAGAEKVVLGTGAWSDPYLISEAAERHGSAAVCVCIDVQRDDCGRPTVRVENGRNDTGVAPEAMARMVEEHGAGEILLQSIDRDGTMSGYDLELTAAVADAVGIPVVALGGAGSYEDLGRATSEGRASAASAGSVFVYRGRFKGVLINYPERTELRCS